MSRAVETRARVGALRSVATSLRTQEKQRAEELLAHVRRNLETITDAFFEVGTALTEIANNKLHLALGYESFQRMLEEEQLMSSSQAHKLIAVATIMPREAAVTLGPEKSYALTRYVRTAEPPGGVGAVLQARSVDGRPLADLSVRDLEAISRRAAARTPGDPRRHADVLARQAQATLRKRGLEGVTVGAWGRAGKRFRVELDEAALRLLLRKV